MPIIGNELCAIFNLSTKNGIFPNWKCSTITPVEKVPGTIKAAEFRPINCMPSYEKIFEIIIKKQIDDYIEENNIIAHEQSGFRKHHSCETSINRVMIEWKRQLDIGNPIICVFLDLKRAFETIDRKTLITKLERIGIRNNEKKWFESYLDNRSQKNQNK